jgi:putative DNA primase/helicase
MSDFTTAMRGSGLRPRDVVPDGRWRRCSTDSHPKKKNAAYMLDIGGRRGVWIDFASGHGAVSWASDREHKPDPVRDARIQAAMERKRADDRAKRIRGIQAARDLWRCGAEYSGHAYLHRKGLSAVGTHQLRMWRGPVRMDISKTDKPDYQDVLDTWLLVPLYWRGRLVNVQRISTTGVKMQMAGAPQSGAMLELGRPRAAVTCIVEGLATGLAVYQSVRTARVLVAFFADNLLPVVREAKPTGNVIFCADNDHATLKRRGFNPGIEKATNAAELVGAGVAWPEDIEGSDFADMLIEHGEGAAKRMERLILGRSQYVLGEMT